MLQLRKIVMYDFLYDYREKAELCYMDTESFIVYIKREDILLRHCKRC